MCESLKIKRKIPDERKITDFAQKFVLQVGVKFAILRFKAKDEVLSLALNSDGHKYFIRDRYFLPIHLLNF